MLDEDLQACNSLPTGVGMTPGTTPTPRSGPPETVIRTPRNGHLGPYEVVQIDRVGPIERLVPCMGPPNLTPNHPWVPHPGTTYPRLGHPYRLFPHRSGGADDTFRGVRMTLFGG